MTAKKTTKKAPAAKTIKLAKGTAKKEPKAAKPAAEKKPKTPKAPQAKKPSALDAAAKALGETGAPMNCQEMIQAMADKGYWSSGSGRPAPPWNNSSTTWGRKRGSFTCS
ncbi:MAG TPA: hypothetical protein VMV10_30290 [Pirellulales bacterium]|nr:hypothetical protein [Pirellulales bacterium]